jgi:hypothetical protein
MLQHKHTSQALKFSSFLLFSNTMALTALGTKAKALVNYL